MFVKCGVIIASSAVVNI